MSESDEHPEFGDNVVHAASLSLDFTEDGARIVLVDEDGAPIAYVEIARGSMRSIAQRMTVEIEKAKGEE